MNSTASFIVCHWHTLSPSLPSHSLVSPSLFLSISDTFLSFFYTFLHPSTTTSSMSLSNIWMRSHSKSNDKWPKTPQKNLLVSFSEKSGQFLRKIWSMFKVTRDAWCAQSITSCLVLPPEEWDTERWVVQFSLLISLFPTPGIISMNEMFINAKNSSFQNLSSERRNSYIFVTNIFSI